MVFLQLGFFFAVDCRGRWNVLRGVCRLWIGGGEQSLWVCDISWDLYNMGAYCHGHDLFGWSHLRRPFQPRCHTHLCYFPAIPLEGGW